MADEDIKKLRRAVKEEIDVALKPIKETLKGHTRKLNTIWDQVTEVTEDLTEVKETLESHTASLNRIEENTSGDIKKVDKRLTTVENQQGIVPPPELTIAR